MPVGCLMSLPAVEVAVVVVGPVAARELVCGIERIVSHAASACAAREVRELSRTAVLRAYVAVEVVGVLENAVGTGRALKPVDAVVVVIGVAVRRCDSRTKLADPLCAAVLRVSV